MRRLSTIVSLIPLLPAIGQAAPIEVTATLAGHVVLPAQTFVMPPADAPHGLFMAGRFAGNERIEQPYARLERTGLARPFPGQALQGFSGIKHLPDGRYLLLTDNGFGGRTNSADAILMLHVAAPDWESGRLVVEETVFLADPDRVVPFPITTEHTDTRYLTGADLDPEAIQPVGNGYWIGDEFGPYLIRVDAQGRVTGFHETMAGGLPVQSPDHHRLALRSDPAEPPTDFNLSRSRGFEGLALAADGRTLLPMLEGQIFDPASGLFETKGARPVVRITTFDTAGGGWGETLRYYPLEEEGHAIGDFNMIDGRRALVIERDWLEGDARLGVAEPAAFKRVYLVDLEAADADGVVEKLGYVDLLTIADPDGIGRAGSIDGIFSLPFVTIESVDVVDDRHIVVGNDNNYPFSMGRVPGVADDSELVLLEVEALLAMR